MSDEHTGGPPNPGAGAYAGLPHDPYQRPEHHSGWLIAVGIVLALAIGGLAVAIISKGDSGGATTPSVPATTVTTVQQSTTTVAPPADNNVTVAPNITLNPSGTPTKGDEGAAQSTTNTSPTTTTSP